MSTPSRCIGGHRAEGSTCLHLYQVTIHTSIEDWEEFVLTPSEAALIDWLNQRAPKHGWAKGYEPTIKRLNSGMLDSIYLITADSSLLHYEHPECL